MKKEEKKDVILNSKTKDSGAKLIFGDNALCAEFIRDYVDIPFAKEVQAEDIEDVSEQFVPLFEEERNADVVKKIKVNEENPFFFISLFEHKAKVDYNVTMQIFRYMVYIWDAYEKEMNKQKKGIAKQANFKYPPIIPIVYYEGKQNWTVPLDFVSRIQNGDMYKKYIPNFEYYFVPLKEYTNETLMDTGDGISLLMMINKLQSMEDIERFRELSIEKIGKIAKTIPEYQRAIIAEVLLTALLKMNVPEDKAHDMVNKVEEKKMAELFECMEEIDIQAEWAKLDVARTEIDAARTEIDVARTEIDVARTEIDVARTDLNIVKEQLAEQQAALDTEKQALDTEKQALDTEKQALDTEKQALEKEREELKLATYIRTLQELDVSYNDTLKRLMKKHDITEEKAKNMIQMYWN